MDSHEKYLELCAASTAGELNVEEELDLEEHLASCTSCQQAKHEFELAVDKAILALDNAVPPHLEELDSNWSIDKIEAAFFERLGTEKNARQSDISVGAAKTGESPAGGRFTYRPSSIPWAELWMPTAACVLLALSLGILAYRSGLKHGTDSVQFSSVPAKSSAGSLERQISDFGYERSQFLTKLAEDDKAINDFKRQVAEQTDEIKRLKGASGNALASKQTGSQPSADASSEIALRDAELVAAQTDLQQLQSKADTLNQQREDTAKQAQALQAKVDELTQLAHDREQALDQQQVVNAKQQVLLDHDRDIRELMGARDLYIAEVHDVAGTGETDKTYGRVFYTKGKSLIFYAYDLDQETDLKTASTFQAWGSRGIDKQQALSLGVFYEDNTSKKRWVLKFDDPKTLANIDAVFVTVEPRGGSHHPSGKQLLFAYLRVTPNHP